MSHPSLSPCAQRKTHSHFQQRTRYICANLAGHNARHVLPVMLFWRNNDNRDCQSARQPSLYVHVSVLLSPQEYNKLVSVYEQVKEETLYQKIAERISKDSKVTYSREEVMKELGITEEDLNDVKI